MTLIASLVSVLFHLVTAQTAASLAQVSIQLPWVHTIEYSGFYMAQAKGHFRKQNLNVDLRPLNFNKPTDPITQVSAGTADFGITGVSAILLARSQGKPLVGVATIYQRSPSVLVALAKAKINQPTDLIGKKIMIDLSGLDGAIYKAMITKAGISLDQVTIVPRTDYTNAPLLSGKIDAMDAYVNNQPVQLEKQGHPISLISPEDYASTPIPT